MKNYFGISRDHSRSMLPIASAAAKDYNELILSIREGADEHDIDTVVSVVKCGVGGHDGRGALVVRESTNSSINRLKEMKSSDYVTDGYSTPLFDSIGDLIEQLQSVPDANDPDVSFVVMVITDGEENSSVKWNGNSLSKKIKELQKTDRWTFTFRVPRGGARELVRYGIAPGNILEWDTSTAGMEKSTAATKSAMRGFYAARASGVRSTDKFYADISDVTVKELKKNLVDISNQVDVYEVDHRNDGVEIRDFVEAQGVHFTKGCAFYQLNKTEKVQDYKQIAIRDTNTGAVYSGFAARDLLGLPQYGEVKLVPGDHGDYEIFVQSTSVNRKLTKGTNLMIWTAMPA
jgi:hypothetical protein